MNQWYVFWQVQPLLIGLNLLALVVIYVALKANKRRVMNNYYYSRQRKQNEIEVSVGDKKLLISGK